MRLEIRSCAVCPLYAFDDLLPIVWMNALLKLIE
jgi:hypothetical protein